MPHLPIDQNPWRFLFWDNGHHIQASAVLQVAGIIKSQQPLTVGGDTHQVKQAILPLFV